MPVIKVLQGKASHVSRISHTAGTADWVQTVHSTQFRIGKQPVVVAGTPNLGDGDDVTLAGMPAIREFRAYAVRNDTTGIEYEAPVGSCGGTSALFFGVVSSAIGYWLVQRPEASAMPSTAGAPIASAFPLSSLLGVPLLMFGVMGLIFGVVIFAKTRRNQQANQALRECPALPPASRTEGASRALERFRDASEDTEPAGLLRTMAGGLVGMFGVGMIGFSLLILLALLTDVLTKRELGVGGSIVVLVIALASAIGGASVARWGFAQRRRRAERAAESQGRLAVPARAVRKRVLQIASGHGGRVTAAEVAAALEIEQEPAERALEEAAEAGEARMLFSPEGVAVYEFSGLVTQKKDAKEPWEL